MHYEVHDGTAQVGDDGSVRDSTERSLATWAWVAVVVGVLDGIGIGLAWSVAVVADIDTHIRENGAYINFVAGPTFPLLAALMLRDRARTVARPPRQDRLAWLFLALGVLSTATIVVFVYAACGLEHRLPGALAAAWVENWSWTGVAPGLTLVLLWFPTGDVPSPRWRWVPPGAGVAVAGMWCGNAFRPGPLADFESRSNPMGWDGAASALDVVAGVGFAALALTFFLAIASLVDRFRRGDAETRLQLRWLLIAVLVIAVTILIPGPEPVADAILALNVLATVMLPVTLAVIFVRRDGLVLPGVLVYGLLSALLLGAYIAVVGTADVLFGRRADRAATLIAAGLIAVLVAPLRARLLRSVDRLVYGDRGDPYAALSNLGRRIAGSPDDLLEEVVLAVADALRAPYVAVLLPGDEVAAASFGPPVSPQVRVGLLLRGAEVGSLVVAQRGPTERYGARDLALLEDLARHISVAAHAAALHRDLQRSRESLVLAREEERRRIRRDLHDGLGPALAGVALGIDAARNTLDRDPSAAAETLAELKGEVQASVRDVRRMVYDLRPPALDQLGLAAAVEEYAARLTERGGVLVEVRAAALPTLPAAVEVAAYRIITEALTNVVRHAGAEHAWVSVVATDGALRVEVADDGVGLGERRGSHGMGLAAMAERAAELGGTCDLGVGDGGGTRVTVSLPMRTEVTA
jgi:two-component system NarL family sensor kinase